LESNRNRYLISHGLKRLVLSRTVGGEVHPCCWKFRENEHGKPTIAATAGLPCLNFNLSHSERLTVVAVCPTFPVGVDIEVLNGTIGTDPTDIVLSPRERAWIETRPLAKRKEDFVRLWTVKEAYVKLLGQGLSLDFSSIEVTLDPVRMVRTEAGGPQPGDLYIETRKIEMRDTAYHLALAIRCSSVGRPIVTLRILHSPFIELYHNDSMESV